MKDIYVNKEGVICACTVEVPEKPIHPDKNDFEFPYLYDRALGEYSSLLRKYFEALKACKNSAVPFDEQDHAFHALYLETKTDYKINATFSEWFNNFPKPDTFYQIEADWEIVEVFSHCTHGEKHYKKVARLKVPAPTVATDNSGEHPSACAKCFDWKECFEFGCQKPEASPVEEEQEELWMQVAVDCHGITIKGVSKVIKELSDKFIITRKS